jgi:hypothetical protein
MTMTTSLIMPVVPVFSLDAMGATPAETIEVPAFEGLKGRSGRRVWMVHVRWADIGRVSCVTVMGVVQYQSCIHIEERVNCQFTSNQTSISAGIVARKPPHN